LARIQNATPGHIPEALLDLQPEIKLVEDVGRRNVIRHASNQLQDFLLAHSMGILAHFVDEK